MKKASFPRNFILIIIILLWCVVILSGYYLIHKPINMEQVLGLSRAVFSLFSVVAFSGLAGAIGRRLFKVEFIHPLERLALQVSLGWGVLSLIWLIIGLFGFYSKGIAWIALLLGWVFLWREAFAWCRELKVLISAWRESGFLERILSSGSAVLIFLQLLFALAPPIKWDALMYHLELPRRYLSMGGFYFISDNPYWGNPQLTESLYSWVMALVDWETATLLGWLFIVIFLLGIFGHITRHLDKTSAWLAIVAVLVGFSFRWMMSWAYVDGLLALYGFTVWVTLRLWQDERNQKWILWTGLFIGFALLTKLTAGILLFISLGTIVIKNGSRISVTIRQSLLLFFVSFFIYSPWLLINGLYTGNPFYPYLLSTPWISGERLAYFAGSNSSLNWHVFWLPLSVTWFGVEAAQVEGVVSYYSDIGPLLVIFAIPGVFGYWRASNIKDAVFWLFVGWLTMAIGGHFSPLLWQTRLYFAIYPALAIAVGYGWHFLAKLSAGGVRLHRVLIALVLLVLGLNLWRDVQISTTLNPLGVTLGVRSRKQYLNEALGWYYPAMQALYSLPSGSKTLFLWEPRGLYAPLESQPDTWIDNWYIARLRLNSPESILQSWRKDGLTHLLIYRAGETFEREQRSKLTNKDWKVFDETLEQLPPPIKFGSDYLLYSIAP